MARAMSYLLSVVRARSLDKTWLHEGLFSISSSGLSERGVGLCFVLPLAEYIFCNVSPLYALGNKLEVITLILPKRNARAVHRHPKPYLTLRTRLIDEASGKYFVGQLTSATV
jgi:hypothetical protein